MFLKRLKAFVFALRGWRFLPLLLKRLKLFTLREVEGFCSCLWMLKVFVVFFLMLKVLAHTFGCQRFPLLLFDVKGYCFYSWVFKVLTFGFRCWKFLFSLLDMKVLTFLFFYVIGLNFHCVSIHQHENNVYKVRFFQKYLKF